MGGWWVEQGLRVGAKGCLRAQSRVWVGLSAYVGEGLGGFNDIEFGEAYRKVGFFGI